MDYLNLANFWGEVSYFVAKVSSSSSSVEIDLLLKQIDYLQEANNQLNSSFRNFVDVIRNTVYILTVIVGLTTTFIFFIYRKNINDAIEDVKKNIEKNLNHIIDQEVDKRISSTIQYRLDIVERLLAQEAIINSTKLIYLIYTDQPNFLRPPEYEIFQNRGFKPEFITSISNRDFSQSVVILDFVNLTSAKEEDRVAILEKVIPKIKSTNKSVLIIYYNRQSQSLNQLREDRSLNYYAIANNQVSLMGYVVDSASILKSLK